MFVKLRSNINANDHTQCLFSRSYIFLLLSREQACQPSIEPVSHDGGLQCVTVEVPSAQAEDDDLLIMFDVVIRWWV